MVATASEDELFAGGSYLRGHIPLVARAELEKHDLVRDVGNELTSRDRSHLAGGLSEQDEVLVQEM